MQITSDFSGLQVNGTNYVPPPPKRPIAAPVRDSDESRQDRQRNSNEQGQTADGRPVFKTLFTDATQANLTAAQGAGPQPLKADVIETSDYERPEKRPETGPVSLSDDDTNGLFAYLGAARQAAEVQASRSTPPQAYVEAATRYAEQSVVSAGLFAGRGETLELQA